MYIKAVYPNSITKYFSQLPINDGVVKKSVSTFFHLIGAQKSTWTVPTGAYFFPNYTPPAKKEVEILLAVMHKNGSLAGLDCSFNFENQTYFNAKDITGPNQWLKVDAISTAPADLTVALNQIVTSIQDMLFQNGVLDTWDFETYPDSTSTAKQDFGFTGYANVNYYRCVRFKLTRKVKGDYHINTNMKLVAGLERNIYVNQNCLVKQQPTHPNYIPGIIQGLTEFNTLNPFLGYNDSSFNSMLVEKFSMSDESVLDDLEYYELGLDIYQRDLTSSGPNVLKKDNYITSVSKKLSAIADFEPNIIGRSVIAPWKPTISNLNFGVSKYIDTFKLVPYQVFIDNSEANQFSTYKKKVLDNSEYNLNLVEGYQELFENYIANSSLQTNTYNYLDDYYTESTSSPVEFGIGFDGLVFSIATASSGGFYVGGDFLNYQGQEAIRLIKLNADGSKDNSFVNGFSATGSEFVITVKEQPDGKVLVGGRFSEYAGGAAGCLIRLNSDGTRDSSFVTQSFIAATFSSPPYFFLGDVNTLELFSDGKMMVGGYFELYGAEKVNHIIKLQANGTRDYTFYTGTGSQVGFDYRVNTIKGEYNPGELPSSTASNLIIGGVFTDYRGLTANRIEILGPTGSRPDTWTELGFGDGFNPADDIGITSVTDIYFPASNFGVGSGVFDQGILVGGSFTKFGGGFNAVDILPGPVNGYSQINVKNLVKIQQGSSPYGYVAAAFITDPFNSVNPNTGVRTIHKNDQGYFLGGNAGLLKKLDVNGNVVTAFNPVLSNSQILTITTLGDSLLVGGYFNNYNYLIRNNINVVNLSTGDDQVTYDITTRLLTNQPNGKKINQGFEILSCPSLKFDNTQVTLKNVSDKVHFQVTYADNSTSTYQTNVADKLEPKKNNIPINTLTFKVSELLNNIAATQSVKYLDVQFELYDHVNLEYKMGPVQRYIIDNNSVGCEDPFGVEEIDYTSIVFKNKEGGFDLFEFNEITDLNSKRNINTYTRPYTYLDNKLSEFEAIYNLEFSKSYQTNTRVLTDEEFVWLEELGKSTQVYILNHSTLELYPIILTSFEYQTSINTSKKVNITFNYSRPEVSY